MRKAAMSCSIRGVRLRLAVPIASLLGGCTHVATYRLPVPVTSAPALFGPLVACASKRPFSIARQADDLRLQYDPQTRLLYRVDGNQFKLEVHLDAAVARAERPAQVMRAKQAGDALFQCAQATLSSAR